MSCNKQREISWLFPYMLPGDGMIRALNRSWVWLVANPLPPDWPISCWHAEHFGADLRVVRLCGWERRSGVTLAMHPRLCAVPPPNDRQISTTQALEKGVWHFYLHDRTLLIIMYEITEESVWLSAKHRWEPHRGTGCWQVQLWSTR